MSAVSAEAWTEWQAALLWELYDKTAMKLESTTIRKETEMSPSTVFEKHVDELKEMGWKGKIYKNSDIIIITSKVNNFPYVALEAKSYGIPVISSSKGDIKKIIKNDFDGYIHYTNSSKVIIDLINRISKKYSKFSKNSVQRSKLFEINKACKKFWNNIL